MAILAAGVNIILLIVFIHQIAVSIQADKVISDISDVISKQMRVLFPEKTGADPEEDTAVDEDAAYSAYSKKTSIDSTEAGYLQYTDSETLMELVCEHDALIRLFHRPGSFLVEGEQIAVYYSNEEPEKGLVKEISEQFILGNTKTSQQDLEFSIHQMVEIACRALSPGVNDPYTAVACIDNLTATLCYLAQAKFPSKYRIDSNNELRVVAEVLDFEGVTDVAFNQIRQFSGGSTSVIIRMMTALKTILDHVKNEGRKKAVIKHAEMVYRHGKETIKEENDLRALKEKSSMISVE